MNSDMMMVFGEGFCDDFGDFIGMEYILGVPVIEVFDRSVIDGTRYSYVYHPKLAQLANHESVMRLRFRGDTKTEFEQLLNDLPAFPQLQAVFVSSVEPDWDIARLLNEAPNLEMLGVSQAGDFGVARYANLRYLMCNDLLGEVLTNCSFPSLESLEFGKLEGFQQAWETSELSKLQHLGVFNEPVELTVQVLNKIKLPDSFCSFCARAIDKGGLQALMQAPFAKQLTELRFETIGIMDMSVIPSIGRDHFPQLQYIGFKECEDNDLETILADLDQLPDGLLLHFNYCSIINNILCARAVGEDGLQALIEAPFANQLTHVVFEATDIMDISVVSSIGRDHFPQLRYLGFNEYNKDGIETIFSVDL